LEHFVPVDKLAPGITPKTSWHSRCPEPPSLHGRIGLPMGLQRPRPDPARHQRFFSLDIRFWWRL